MDKKDDGVIKEGLPDISPYPYQPLKLTEEDFTVMSGTRPNFMNSSSNIPRER